MFTIHRVEANDFEAWFDLWKAYQAFYKVNISIDTTQVTFNRFLDGQQPIHCLVLKDETKRLVGFVHYVFHLSTWTQGHYCYLQDLFVQSEQRNLGLGRILIEAVYSEAKKHECARVYWLTQENNYPARMLYDRVAENSGFIQYRKLIKP